MSLAWLVGVTAILIEMALLPRRSPRPRRSSSPPAVGYYAAELYAQGRRLLCIAQSVQSAGWRAFGHTSMSDFDLPSRLLPVSATDEELGACIRAILQQSSQSQGLRTYEGGGFKRKGVVMPRGTKLAYDPEANEKLARLFERRSATGLFRGMRRILIFQDPAVIEFSPSWRARGGVFNGYERDHPDTKDSVVSMPATDAELGAAARDALARSSG